MLIYLTGMLMGVFVGLGYRHLRLIRKCSGEGSCDLVIYHWLWVVLTTLMNILIFSVVLGAI